MVTAIHQPPYVIKKLSTDGAGNVNIAWDGLEIRLLRILGQRLNFSYEILEPKIGNAMGLVIFFILPSFFNVLYFVLLLLHFCFFFCIIE